MKPIIVLGAGLLALAPLRTHAQVTEEPEAPYPDPAKLARGLFADAEAGTLMFVGTAREPLGFGTALGVRLGYDVFRWAAVQAHAFASSHRTRFGDAPQAGQLLQLYQAAAELKLTVPLGAWSLSAFGGAGFAWLSTNLLGTTALTAPDLERTPLLLGGLGLDYHTMSRHFSFGFAPTFVRYSKVRTTGAVLATLYVRYTF